MSTNTPQSLSPSIASQCDYLTDTVPIPGGMRENPNTGETFAYDRLNDEWFRVGDAVYSLGIINQEE